MAASSSHSCRSSSPSPFTSKRCTSSVTSLSVTVCAGRQRGSPSTRIGQARTGPGDGAPRCRSRTHHADLLQAVLDLASVDLARPISIKLAKRCGRRQQHNGRNQQSVGRTQKQRAEPLAAERAVAPRRQHARARATPGWGGEELRVRSGGGGSRRPARPRLGIEGAVRCLGCNRPAARRSQHARTAHWILPASPRPPPAPQSGYRDGRHGGWSDDPGPRAPGSGERARGHLGVAPDSLAVNCSRCGDKRGRQTRQTRREGGQQPAPARRGRPVATGSRCPSLQLRSARKGAAANVQEAGQAQGRSGTRGRSVARGGCAHGRGTALGRPWARSGGRTCSEVSCARKFSSIGEVEAMARAVLTQCRVATRLAQGCDRWRRRIAPLALPAAVLPGKADARRNSCGGARTHPVRAAR